MEKNRSISVRKKYWNNSAGSALMTELIDFEGIFLYGGTIYDEILMDLFN